MATLASAAQQPRTGFAQAGRALLELYPRGAKLFWLAPLTVALVIVPEFLQHVAEIDLGMFLGKEQALAVADSPQRMSFGYAKIAGLVLTFLATARFWWTHEHGGRWWDLRQVAWGRLLLGLLIFIGIPALPDLIKGQVSPVVYQSLAWGLMVLTLPMLFLTLAGLFGDRATPMRAMWRRGWPWLILTALLLVLAFAPAQWLHGMNHRWAMGAAPIAVWALMIFDSLLVGLLAGLTGTALFLGYDAFVRSERARDAH